MLDRAVAAFTGRADRRGGRRARARRPRLKLAALPDAAARWRTRGAGCGRRDAAPAPTGASSCRSMRAAARAPPRRAALAVGARGQGRAGDPPRRSGHDRGGLAPASRSRAKASRWAMPRRARGAGQGRRREAAGPGGRGRSRPRDAARIGRMNFVLKLAAQAAVSIRCSDSPKGCEHGGSDRHQGRQRTTDASRVSLVTALAQRRRPAPSNDRRPRSRDRRGELASSDGRHAAGRCRARRADQARRSRTAISRSCPRRSPTGCSRCKLRVDDPNDQA